MKALIVDDSRAMRAILKRAIGSLGFDISEAEDGCKALEVLQGGAVDIALVDWNMPNMNGFELLTNLRKDARYSGMRIVMVTTESEMGNMTAAIEAGADEYMMKPFSVDDLRAKLEMVGVLAAA